MQNIQLKRELLSTHKYEQIQQAKYQAYKNNEIIGFNDLDPLTKLSIIPELQKTELDTLMYVNFLAVKKYMQELTEIEYKCFTQMQKSRSKQRKEIKNQLIFWILNDYTVTFNTYTLNEETYCRYISDLDKLQNRLTRMLKKNTDDYIGNIDYGSQNDRFHFHTLEAYKKGRIKEEIRKNTIDITSANTIEWEKFGFTYPEIIKYNLTSYTELSSYLAKLCNHSIKSKKKRLFKFKDSLYKKYKLWLRRKYKHNQENKQTMQEFINYTNNKHIIKEGTDKNKQYQKLLDETFVDTKYDMIKLIEQV